MQTRQTNSTYLKQTHKGNVSIFASSLDHSACSLPFINLLSFSLFKIFPTHFLLWVLLPKKEESRRGKKNVFGMCWSVLKNRVCKARKLYNVLMNYKTHPTSSASVLASTSPVRGRVSTFFYWYFWSLIFIAYTQPSGSLIGRKQRTQNFCLAGIVPKYFAIE